jgi:tyrosine-protein phosphatase SIW14
MKYSWLRYGLGLAIVAFIVGGPYAYSRYRQANYRNFRVVEEGKLYRSGQMSLPALKSTIEEYNIKTVISLRYAEKDGDRPPDWREEEFCNKNGIRYVRIRPREWHDMGQGFVPADQPVAELLKVMDDPTIYPALIHCFAGMHRTGSFCSIYRMEYQQWSNAEAMAELKALGYKNLDKEEDVQGYLENYVPRWKRIKP